MSSPYKPSPLSYGSPNRAFPFRRPESPASPSPRPLRQSTPSPSPTMMKSAASRTYQESENRTFRGLPQSPREAGSSPLRAPKGTPSFGPMLTSGNAADNNALSKLQPAQVRELREGFQLLDRDSDGLVGREDIVDMLTQLGSYRQRICSAHGAYRIARTPFRNFRHISILSTRLFAINKSPHISQQHCHTTRFPVSANRAHIRFCSVRRR